MKPRTAEAARLEADYITRVRATIADREASESDEIIQSVEEYIEEEVSGIAADQVSLVQMANVLERLGPPEAYAQEENVDSRPATRPEPTSGVDGPRLSKLAVASVLCPPGAVIAAGLTSAIVDCTRPGVSPAGVVFLGVMMTGTVLGISALIAIRNASGKLRGRALAWIGVLALPLLLLVSTSFRLVMTAYCEPPLPPHG